MKILLDLDNLLRQQKITPDEAKRLRGLVEPNDRRIRGIWWLIVPALLGLIVGQLFGAVRANVNPILLFGEGGIGGLILGAGVGVLLWIFFPYVDGPQGPPAPTTFPSADHEDHDPDKCPACGADVGEEPSRCPSCGIKLR